jgi:hypothetical protein
LEKRVGLICGNSVFPRSWFAVQMQDPPPSASGSRFFELDDEDDSVETEGRASGRRRTGKGSMQVEVGEVGEKVELRVPRVRKSVRTKEVRLNELGYRMTWHQSRVFAGKTVFLQKACKFLPSFPPCHFLDGSCGLGLVYE